MSHIFIDANGDQRHQYTVLYTVSMTRPPQPDSKFIKRESESICKSRNATQSN